MSGVNTRSISARFRDNNREQGKDFVNLCDVKKHVGDTCRGECKNALDDMSGI